MPSKTYSFIRYNSMLQEATIMLILRISGISRGWEMGEFQGIPDPPRIPLPGGQKRGQWVII